LGHLLFLFPDRAASGFGQGIAKSFCPAFPFFFFGDEESAIKRPILKLFFDTRISTGLLGVSKTVGPHLFLATRGTVNGRAVAFFLSDSHAGDEFSDVTPPTDGMLSSPFLRAGDDVMKDSSMIGDLSFFFPLGDEVFQETIAGPGFFFTSGAAVRSWKWSSSLFLFF